MARRRKNLSEKRNEEEKVSMLLMLVASGACQPATNEWQIHIFAIQTVSAFQANHTDTYIDGHHQQIVEETSPKTPWSCHWDHGG